MARPRRPPAQESGQPDLAQIDALVAARAPALIGIRHHSPACAAAVPMLLEALDPELIFLELPPELAPWLPWLGHAEAIAPLALAGISAEGAGLSFYPFADFSPELVVVRWAIAHGVPVEPFDLPLSQRAPATGEGAREGHLLPAIRAAAGASDAETLWDQLVEARAAGGGPEEIRRAGLAFGWAMRTDSAESGVSQRDLTREAYMRTRLEVAGVWSRKPPRAVAVVGAFHAPALVREPSLWSPPQSAPSVTDRPATTSLVPYGFELLDSRSGYPAGIRDPRWQQQAFEAFSSDEPSSGITRALVSSVVDICRSVRRRGHVAGTPEAIEATRLASDLAHLRGLSVPGRRELIEAIQTAIGRGEPLGFGRVLARAMEEVLVGRQRGRLAPGTPRSGLAPHVDDLLAALDLPRPEPKQKAHVDVSLDPLRSPLDRRRAAALERLATCSIPYAERLKVGGLGPSESLTSAWRVRWQPATDAMIELAAMRGVTLEQAAAGTLRAREMELAAADQLDARARLSLLETACRCGLPELVNAGVEALTTRVLPSAGLAELIGAYGLLESLERSHFPALPPPGEESKPGVPGALAAFTLSATVNRAEFLAAAVRAIEGLAGSEHIEDVHALHDVVETYRRQSGTSLLGNGRLGVAIDALAREGSALMQGAGNAARLLLDRTSAIELSETLGAWIDVAVDRETRRTLAHRLRGVLRVAATLLESDIRLLEGTLVRVDSLPDDTFLKSLPALREGFDVVSPAGRQRLLEALGDRYATHVATSRPLDADTAIPPELLAIQAAADRAGRDALVQLGLEPESFSVGPARLTARGFELPTAAPPAPRPDRRLSGADRWRLILGREAPKLSPQAQPLNRALDELYGRGHGEGSRDDFGTAGGQGTAFPTVREWAGELDALFGADVREEVLGRAIARGRPTAASELSPESVTPSVELLEQLLSLKGGLGEGAMVKLRALIHRVVDDLVRALAVRLQPALHGLATSRPTRRTTGLVDLRRTVVENLHTARRVAGAWQISPERLTFRSRSRRSMDWRIILAVDVSGSMEPSVIYSAMMAAILSRLPAVSVHFVAFSTDVVDLTDHVDDPLALLLEVKVGGGTHIAKALRYCRQLVTVPGRTLLLTVSDFEEGFAVESLVAETRAICESGVKALGLAALDDAGKPRFAKGVAELVAGAGMPVAALTPLQLAQWVREQLQ